MQKVAHKLQIIKQIHEELIKTYKHFFQTKMKSIQEKLYQVKLKSIMLVKKKGFFKTLRQIIYQCASMDTLVIKYN